MIRKVKRDYRVGYTIAESDVKSINVELRQGEIWELNKTYDSIKCRKGRNEIIVSKELAEELFDLGEKE